MSEWKAEKGVLYVVATPIGNLDDLSVRARDILCTVDWIASEDTRQTRKLTSHLGSRARLHSVHRGNEVRLTDTLIQSLRAGDAGALVSDAGTPLVSDPGRWLVSAALEAELVVMPLPGPCAAVAALSAAGFEATQFVFEGFLPARAPARRRRLDALVREERTWVVYEAPHRIRALVGDLREVLEADREVVWARELSKRHEQVVRVRAGQLRSEEFPQRGEYVVVVSGAPQASEASEEVLDDFLMPLLETKLGIRVIASLARDCLGVARKRAYDRAVVLQDQSAQSD